MTPPAIKSKSPARSKYELAKRAFDMRDYHAAVAGFIETLSVLSEPELAGPASHPPLSDLRVLATGFNELAIQAIASQTAPLPGLPPQLAPVPDPPAVATHRVPPIYDTNDLDVTPPVTVKQDIPRFSRPVLVEKKGYRKRIQVTLPRQGN